MAGSVVSFFRRALGYDWSTQELAEFYRVEAALVQAGVRVVSDRGLTDEGDPWFVFCRTEDEEVIVHFARVRGEYLISAPSYGTHATGRDFRALVRDLVERHGALQPVRRSENVSYHPSALLVVLVASAFLKAGYAHAADAAPVARTAASANAGESYSQEPRISVTLPEHALDTIAQDFPQNAALLSAMTFVIMPLPEPAPTMVVTAHTLYVPLPDHGLSVLLMGSADNVVPMIEGSGSVTPSSSALANLAMQTSYGVHGSEPAAALATAPAAGGSGYVAAASEAGPPMSTWGPHAADIVPTNTNAALLTPPASTSITDLATTVLHDLGNGEPIIYSSTVPATFIVPLHQSLHVDHPNEVAATLVSLSLLVPTAVVPSGASPVASNPSGPAWVVPSQNSAGPGDVSGQGGTQSGGTSPVGGLPLADLGPVLNFVHTFSEEVGSHLAAVVTPTRVIVYDAYAIDHSSAAVSAVTYDFVDGSSVSLVGLPSELPHIHL